MRIIALTSFSSAIRSGGIISRMGPRENPEALINDPSSSVCPDNFLLRLRYQR